MSDRKTTEAIAVDLDPMWEGMVDALVEHREQYHSRSDLIEQALRAHLGVDAVTSTELTIELPSETHLLLQTFVDDPNSEFDSTEEFVAALVDAGLERHLSTQ